MNPATTLPTLLLLAWLLPLASFVLIVFFGKHMGTAGRYAGHVATGAIVGSCVLSLFALFGVWLPGHPLDDANHGKHGIHENIGAEEVYGSDDRQWQQTASPFRIVAYSEDESATKHDATEEAVGHHATNGPPTYYAGDWYALGVFGRLKLTIGYYIDTLTLVMFCLVSLISSCVHFYSTGYMHDELHEFTDPEVTLADGQKLRRRGRYYRFFQYLSLFSFSMLGVCIAGNMAMVFVFWELVGICSYFLIGFYIERQSASDAANKAFIVNRIGDFGMLIGHDGALGEPGDLCLRRQAGCPRAYHAQRRRRDRRARGVQPAANPGERVPARAVGRHAGRSPTRRRSP